MFVLRGDRIFEILDIRTHDGVLIRREEHDLGSREEALADVDRRIAYLRSERNRVLSAPEGGESIPAKAKSFQNANHYFVIGENLYSSYCTYGEGGSLKSVISERVGSKRNILDTLDAQIVELEKRYQEILEAKQEA